MRESNITVDFQYLKSGGAQQTWPRKLIYQWDFQPPWNPVAHLNSPGRDLQLGMVMVCPIFTVLIWRLTKMGLPPNHPFLSIFERMFHCKPLGLNHHLGMYRDGTPSAYIMRSKWHTAVYRGAMTSESTAPFRIMENHIQPKTSTAGDNCDWNLRLIFPWWMMENVQWWI